VNETFQLHKGFHESHKAVADKEMLNFHNFTRGCRLVGRVSYLRLIPGVQYFDLVPFKILTGKPAGIREA